MRIVGVVGGVRAELFETGPSPFVYQPFGQMFRGNIYVHVRTTAASADEEAAMLPVVRMVVTPLPR